MVTINEFLDNVLKDFKAYVDSQDQLCDLLDAHFDAGKVPDYSDVHIQQLYLLRYAYGYAFEYKQMYKDLMARIKLGDKIKVTSVGCGNLIDYWALANVLKQKCNIFYIGIDAIDWSYKFEQRPQDEIKMGFADAVPIFQQANSLSSDIYVFPKSISEFEDDEIKAIAECFSKITKDRVHFLVSLRSDIGSMKRDAVKTNIIFDKMRELSFRTGDRGDQYYHLNAKLQGKKIREVDKDFQHPSDVVNFLEELDSYCASIKTCPKSSNCKPRLNRFPILNCQYAAWQIFTFER